MENRFSDNLRLLREQAGLTQRQLGEKLGSTQRKISFMETGAIEPDIDMLLKIAHFFEVSVDYLLGKDPT